MDSNLSGQGHLGAAKTLLDAGAEVHLGNRHGGGSLTGATWIYAKTQ